MQSISKSLLARVLATMVGLGLLPACESISSGGGDKTKADTFQADAAGGDATTSDDTAGDVEQTDTGSVDASQDDAAQADTADDDAAQADTAEDDTSEADASASLCLPQAPRDISVGGGVNTNPILGPGSDALWLCNVHFHNPPEHAGFLSCPDVAPGGDPVCLPEPATGSSDEEVKGVHTGDVVEVHWVYSSCNVADMPPPEAGKGLEPCLCASGQVLRVRAQVFVVDDQQGVPEVWSPPAVSALASYAGSTTGTKYNATTCSPYGVNWEVGVDCLPLHRAALGQWCGDNPFGEKHAHDARELVEN